MQPSSVPRSLAAAAGIRDTQPSTPVARAKASSIDLEVDSKRPLVETPKYPEVQLEEPQAATPKPSPVSQRAPVLERAVGAPAQPAADASYGVPGRATTRPSLPVLAVLWVITAAVPAIVVWSVMRNPSAQGSSPSLNVEKRESIQAVPKRAHESMAQPAPAEPAAAPGVAEKVAEPAPVPSTSTTPSSPASADSSAVAAASTVPVVIETDSSDRVSILIKTKPRSAKVYKRSKEIGRTPLIIQIGRGEHRIFEVGVNLGATKRISLDGEKSEITVTLPEVKAAAPNPAPAPAP